MKKFSKGYILAETLIVTIFVASVLMYVLVQLTNLSSNYEYTHKYNTVPDLYALIDVVYFLNGDELAKSYVSGLDDNVSDLTQVCIDNPNLDTCVNLNELSELENISRIFVSKNESTVIFGDLIDSDEHLKKFVSKITWDGIEEYRLIVTFNDGSFATLKFDLY